MPATAAPASDGGFNIATATQNQVVGRLNEVKIALQTIQSKGDAITESDIVAGEELATELKALMAKSAVFGRANSFGQTVQAAHDHLTKPVGGFAHVGGDGTAGTVNDKGVSLGASGRIEGVETKVAPWAIFGTKGGFFDTVRRFGNVGNPEQDASTKVASWLKMCKDANYEQFETKTTPAGLWEGSDPDGGILVPAETSQAIYSRTLELENLWSRIDNLTVRGNTMTFPALEDHSRKDGARDGGVLGYWEGEGTVLSASKPNWRLDALRLKKLSVLVYATDELLSDSPFGLANYLTDRAAKEIAFKLNFGIMLGTGNGMPQGIINAKCTLQVAKATGQPAASVVTQNINDMYMALWAPYRKKAVWMINQNVESSLQSMGLPVGIAGQPTYLPPGGLSSAPYGTLKGLPVLVIEQASSLGTPGDITLACWDEYRGISKGGIDTAISMHVRFLTAEQTFRFIFRADGQPKWEQPLTPYLGNNTYSPFITLAAR